MSLTLIWSIATERLQRKKGNKTVPEHNRHFLEDGAIKDQVQS